MRTDEEETNDVKFCIFNKTYNKFLELENLIKKSGKEEVINYIADNISNYISMEDKKMRIMSLVSILELLLTHKPDSNRYNIEDSIRKQFCNKILILLYLNYKNINYVEEEKYLLMVYDLRSAIAHGSFEQIDMIAKKMDRWFFNNSTDYKEYYEGFNIDIVFEYIEESLEKYVRTSIKMFLEDQKLIELLKK